MRPPAIRNTPSLPVEVPAEDEVGGGEVGRAHPRPVTVDDRGLRVHHRAEVLEDPYPGVQRPSVPGMFERSSRTAASPRRWRRCSRDDFAHSRAIEPGRTGQPDIPKPEGRRSPARDTPLRRAPRGVGVILAAGGRGSAGVQGAPRGRYRAIPASAGLTAVLVSLLIARFPRLLAWPLAALGAAAGASRLRVGLGRRALDDGG